MASNLAPPPPPVGGPPPLPPPGLPPPPFAPPATLMGGGPPAPPVPPRNPFSPTLLLTNVPPFLHTYKAVRDWLYPCGGVRNCIFYPKKPEDDDGDAQELPSHARISVVVTMSHPDGACKFLGAFKQFVSRLDDRYNTLQAYMVPANKDVPLPPPLLDEESQLHLGEKLWQNFVAAEAPELHGGEMATAGSNSQQLQQQPLDAEKVAAAAGGNNYDAEEDPLNAPAVLEAVKEFRRKLTKTQSFQKKKRMELVAQKLAEMKPRVAAMVEDEKKRGPPITAVVPPPPLPPPGSLSLPPPPPPPMAGGLPPPPLGGLFVPPGGAAGDSGKRGRSNLPAWMTTQGQAAAENEEPATKRAKNDYPSHFPVLPESTHATLRDFLGAQVQEALGEEEAELIQFLYSHILACKSTAEMLQELQMVLEEEAGGFLKAVWAKVDELVLAEQQGS